MPFAFFLSNQHSFPRIHTQYKLFIQITMHECKRYLEKEETNVLLTSVPTEHAASLKFLFSKVAFTQRHPACAFWWCFWDDLWNANKEVRKKERATISFIVLFGYNSQSRTSPPVPRFFPNGPLPILLLRLERLRTTRQSWIQGNQTRLLFGQCRGRSLRRSSTRQVSSVPPAGAVTASLCAAKRCSLTIAS